MEGDLENEEEVEKKLKGHLNEDLYNSVTEMRLMYKHLREELKLQKGNIAKKVAEMDKEKYLTLISEFRKFKMNNVQHFRFNSAANSTSFSKFYLSFFFGQISMNIRRGPATLNPTAGADLL